MKPEFPLTATFDDGEVEVYNSIQDVAMSLEWYDTNDTEQRLSDTHVIIRDAKNRLVSVRVEGLQVQHLELVPSVPSMPGDTAPLRARVA